MTDVEAKRLAIAESIARRFYEIAVSSSSQGGRVEAVRGVLDEFLDAADAESRPRLTVLTGGAAPRAAAKRRRVDADGGAGASDRPGAS